MMLNGESLYAVILLAIVGGCWLGYYCGRCLLELSQLAILLARENKHTVRSTDV